MAKTCQIIELDNNTAISWDSAQKRFLHNGTVSTFGKIKEAQETLKEIRSANKITGLKTKYEIVEVGGGENVE